MTIGLSMGAVRKYQAVVGLWLKKEGVLQRHCRSVLQTHLGPALTIVCFLFPKRSKTFRFLCEIICF